MESLFENPPVIETEYYLLRGMTPKDSADMFRFMADRETMKFITSHPVTSEKEVQEKIETYLDRLRQGKEIPWMIEDKANGTVIGMVRLHKIHSWHKKAELGAVIREENQRTGVMSEVLESVLAFAFADLGLNRIVGDIFAENKASEKLLKKYGFRKEGQLRQTDFDGRSFHDTVVYSLLKPEFEARRSC